MLVIYSILADIRLRGREKLREKEKEKREVMF